MDKNQHKQFTHSWSSALLENLPIVQLLKNFPAFYGTRKFITPLIQFNSILYYLYAEPTATRPITGTAQCSYK
jgi:hypothetical protein